MKNIRSILNEIVYLLTINNNTNNKLTFDKYKRCYKSIANIMSINEYDYSIIFPKPPLIFANTVLVGVDWNNKEYQFVSSLQLYNTNFIKTIINLA